MNSDDRDQCEICKKERAQTFLETIGTIHQDCPRCGEFKAEPSACTVLRRPLGDAKRARLSGWVRSQNHARIVPTITTHTLENVLNQPFPSVAERARALLVEAELGLENLGDYFNINDARFLAATYSISKDDVSFLLKLLSEQGLVEAIALGGQCAILPAGYMELDELRTDRGESTQGFVAMWFDKELSDVHQNGFEVGVFAAGYDPIRVDHVEHVNRIDDEIIRQINASRFVVADFTGHRGGVYFEAGYALGREIPVFWTCRKSDISKLHFDIRQFNCIDWETAEELARRLESRLEAVLGPGPKKK